jgi:DNA-binding LacI/PurR family transcriptional regulator
VKPSVTLKDVAQHAGVSPTTVSRVIRGEKYVSPAIREHVIASARALGYRRDPMLSALREHRRRLSERKSYQKIGIINLWPRRSDWLSGNRPGQTLHQGMQARAAELGFETEVFHPANAGGEMARLLRMLNSRGIAALVLLPVPLPLPEFFRHNLEQWREFVIVSVEHPFGYPDCHYVWTDQFLSACTLWDELWKRGYRRIGLELPWQSSQRTHGLWESAYLLRQHHSGLSEEDRLPILRTRADREDFLRYFRRNKPDAMIGKSAEMCDWVRQEGLQIPEDFGFASFDCDAASNSVAGILQRRAEVGAAAIDLILKLIQERQYGGANFNRGTLIPGLWQDGRTVR